MSAVSIKNYRINRIFAAFLIVIILLGYMTAIPANAAVSSNYVSINEAINVVHNDLLAHKKNITVYVSTDIDLYNDSWSPYYEVFIPAAKDNPNSEYGYSPWFNSEWPSCQEGAEITKVCKNKWIIKFLDINYLTTQSQEKDFNRKLENIIEQLDLWNKSDYMKYKGIYEYICDNVTYDEEAYAKHCAGNYTDRLPYTAYAALMEGKAVCAGYSRLFYAMCRYMGLPSRYVLGIADGRNGWSNHAWNLVKLNNNWYQLDVTWDAGTPSYNWRYFLKGDKAFSKDHALDSQADIKGLSNEDYEVQNKDYAMISRFRDTDGLECYDAVWALSDKGIISGTGKTTFTPAATISRGEIATMLYRCIGDCDGRLYNIFKDVSTNDYYNEAAAFCAMTGIVTGYPDGTFRGKEKITYEQLAVILRRFAEYIGAENANKTIAIQLEGVSEYADESVRWAIANGILNNNSLIASVTRGDAAVMLQLALSL